MKDFPEDRRAKIMLTPLHYERSMQIRKCIEHDVVTRGMTMSESVIELSNFLGVEPETIWLGLRISNSREEN